MSPLIISFFAQNMLSIHTASILTKPLQGIIGSPHVVSVPKIIVLKTAGIRRRHEDCKPPVLYEDINVPETDRTLKVMPKQPLQVPVDLRRNAAQIRGPCTGEGAQLKHGQYGIIALKGGWLKNGHFNVISLRVNKFIKKKPLFAEWRVAAPYHPVTRHPIQAVMGGGKGSIDHYVTPVKSRQVIVELAGKAEFVEVYPTLKNIAMILPVPAIAVDKAMLQAMYDEELRLEDENENFFTFRELIEKNMQGIGSKVSLYDYRHFGKMR